MGELVDALSLARAPGSDAIRHACVPLSVCGRVPGEVPRPCCQPGLHRRRLLLARLAGGINPRREIAVGRSGDCHGLPIPSALCFPQHLSPLQQRFCLQWEVPGGAAGPAWGQLSSAVPCAVPARVPARRPAALQGMVQSWPWRSQGMLASGSSFLAPVFLKFVCPGVLWAALVGRCFER